MSGVFQPADEEHPLFAHLLKEKESSVEETLRQRGQRYGDFTNRARICQGLKHIIMYDRSSNWHELSADKKQALEVIADKIARILSGDPDYKDNWHDIQGYAKLAEDRCEEQDKSHL
jgi:hypothetical protein